ncbi:hypothetical protein [Haloferax sp. DFSO52]|uniref:DUF7856 family protein n=1 Tax=Haloferax sp. DFSO52 TaxID=3388505 RepID=UPI003A84AFAF
MKVHLSDGTVREGRGIDLSATALDPETVVAAIRIPEPASTSESASGSASESADASIRIECADPGPGHDTLARVPVSNATPGRLLAAVGRSRGMASPVDEELDQLSTRLAAHEVTDPDHTTNLRAARRRLADAGADEARLRERSATLRGRLAVHREAGDDDATEATRSELVDVATELSEIETERIAAEQRLDALEREATRLRDSRDERLRLTDAIANRLREARAYFADELATEFDDARDELADLFTDAPRTDAPPADAVASSLAAVKLADLRAPIVSMCRCFPDAETAASHLDVPVIRL